jgi:hypothetical protein
MVRPFKNGITAQACPMGVVMAELAGQLAELENLKRAVRGGDSNSMAGTPVGSPSLV